MKKLFISVLSMVFMFGYSFANAPQPHMQEDALSAINQAESRGEISKVDAAKYRANLVLDSQKNPKQFQLRQTMPLKCGLPLYRQIQADWNLLDPQIQAKLLDIQTRYQTDYTYDTPEGHFKLHYNTTGTEAVYEPTVDHNSNGVPDYVERVGSYFEASWSFLDSLGFDHAPSDGSLGGDSRYDVYFHSYSGAYGVTFPEGSASSQYPGRNAYYSHINIDPNFQGFPHTPDQNSQVTAVHEFFHAVQFAYNVLESSWLMETSSTWIEDEKYTNVNDYLNYLSSVFTAPYLSITSTNGVHEYGNCIWLHHMTESKSEDLVRQIWVQAINNNNGLTSAANALSNYNPSTSLDEDFNEYVLWNYFTGSQRSHTNMQTYAEANSFPQVSIYHNYSQYPVEDASVTSSVYPQGYGANYIRFAPSQNPKQNLLLILNGNDNANWHYQLVSDVSGTYSVVASQDGDANGDATFFVPNWPSKDELVLIVSVDQNSSTGHSYTYSAMETNFAVYYEGFLAQDDVVGNNNGQLEPGETGSVYATFTNYGQALSNVHWVLRTQDPDISIIDSTADYSSFDSGITQSNQDQKFTFQVSQDALPHLAQLVVTLTDGVNTVAQETLNVLVGYPKTLLVDDQNGTDGDALRAALDADGIVYDHRILSESGLGNMQLSLRNTIIWTTGETYLNPLPTDERDSLQVFLDRGGRLLLFGNKILLNSGNNDFIKNYLGVEPHGFAESAFLTGMVDDPISQGNYIKVASTQYPDDIAQLRDDPYVSTVWKFASEQNPGIVKVNNGQYKVVFGTMPFGSIYSDNATFLSPEEVLQRALDWLADTTNSAPTMPQAIEPQDNSLVTMTQPTEESITFHWHAATDVDGDPVRYIFQLDTTATFAHPNVLFERDYADTTLDIAGSKLDSLITTPGDTVQLYWRVFASDYSDISHVQTMSLKLTTDTTGTGTQNERPALPVAFNLSQNYPNPFNPSTTVSYDVPHTGYVNITVYDMLGNVVKTLVHSAQTPGHYTIRWNGLNNNGQNVASGIYFIQMRSSDFLATRKITLLR